MDTEKKLKLEIDRTLIATTLALLENYKIGHVFSLLLSVSTLLLLVIAAIFHWLDGYWFSALCLLILFGLLQMLYAFRIGLDIKFLKSLLISDQEMEDALAALDQSLMSLKLLPSDKAGRPLAQRLQGCMRLFKFQIAFTLAQVSVLPFAVGFKLMIGGLV